MSPQKSFWTVPHIMLAILGIVGLLLIPVVREEGISLLLGAVIGLQFGNWLCRPHRLAPWKENVATQPVKPGWLLSTAYIIAEIAFATAFLFGATLRLGTVARTQVAFVLFCMIYDTERLYRARVQ